MKKKHLCTIFLALFMLCLTGCSKDDEDNTLRLDGVQNNSITAYYRPHEVVHTAGALTIIGGDNHYSVTSCNPAVLDVEQHYPNAFLLHLKDIGEAVVVVMDGSGQSYSLHVHVTYQTEIRVVRAHDVRIVDNSLTQEARNKEQLRKEALATIPAKVGGGYYFVHDSPESEYKGTVTLFSDKYGKDGVKTAFEFFYRKTDIPESQPGYHIKLGDEAPRTFYLAPYNGVTRTSISVRIPIALEEDVTDRLQTKYENVRVYAQQIF